MLVLLVAGVRWLVTGPSSGDGVTPVVDVRNACDANGCVFVGLAATGDEPAAAAVSEVVAGRTETVTLVHDPDRDPTGDDLVVAIGTKSSDLDALVEASSAADPPTVTVTGSCVRGDPCVVDGTSVRCAPRQE